MVSLPREEDQCCEHRSHGTTVSLRSTVVKNIRPIQISISNLSGVEICILKLCKTANIFSSIQPSELICYSQRQNDTQSEFPKIFG